MRLRRRLLLPLLAALAPAAIPAAAQAAPTPGLNVSRLTAPAANVIAELDLAKRMNVKVVRTELLWGDVEVTGKGAYDQAVLANADEIVAAAKARGLKLVLLLQTTPCWASSKPQKDCSSADGRDAAAAWPPSDPGDFAHFAKFAAARYRDALAAVEVWNEPDQANEFYFAGPDKPQRYAAILRAAYGPIKAAAPGVPVIGGSIVGANGTFLKALYRAGIKGSYDALSVHYYDKVLASLRSIRAVQRAAGDSKPLWLAETGWTSCKPKTFQGGHFCVTRAKQASNLDDLFRATRRTSYVKGIVVYSLYDTPQYDFGMVDLDGRPKPVFTTLAKVFEDGAKAPRRPTLKLRRSGGRVLVSGSGPAGDDFGLLVTRGGQLRYTATIQLDRENRFAVKLPRALGSRGLKVRFYQYWLGGGVVRSI